MRVPTLNDILTIASLLSYILSLLLSITIAIISGIFALVKSIHNERKQKFESSEAYIKEILDWFYKCVHVIIRLRDGDLTYEENYKKYDLAQLSALIELGRFYFPNERDETNNYHKPAAYQGARIRCLDYLVFIYSIAETHNLSSVRDDIGTLERLFTSFIFIYIDPYKRLDSVSAHSDIDNNFTLDDILNNTEKWQIY